MLASHQDFLRILCGYLAQGRKLRFEDTVSEPLQTITVIFPGPEWSVRRLRIVVREAVAKVFALYPDVRVRVYVDDIKAAFEKQECEAGAANR